MVEIEYTMERRDHLLGVRALLDHSASLRAGWRQTLIEHRSGLVVIGIVLAATTVGAWRLVMHGDIAWSGALIFVAVFQFFFIIKNANPRAMRERVLAIAAREVQRGTYDWIQGRWAIRASPEALWISSPGSKARLEWSRVHRIVRSLECVAIISNSGATPIPSRAFLTDRDADDFARELQRFLSEAGAGAAKRIGDYTHEREAACAVCGYSLMNLSAERCPECGEPIDINELRERERER